VRGPGFSASACRAVAPGEYLHSQRDLYRIEEISGDRIMVEECRSGALIEIGPGQLLALEPVVRSASRAEAGLGALTEADRP